MKRILFALLLLCSAAAVLVLLRCAWAILTNKERAWSIIRMFDRLGNVAANDDSGYYISTRAYIAQHAGKRWGRWLAGMLDAIEKDHCRKSFEADFNRKQDAESEWMRVYPIHEERTQP